MNDIEKDLREARPPLVYIAPLTHKLIIGFAFINLAIAFLLGFITQATKIPLTDLPIIGDFFNTRAWAVVFLGMAISKFFALYANNWRLARRILSFGLFVTVLWSLALLALLVQGEPVWITTALWLFLAWVHIWTIIYFVPPIEKDLLRQRTKR